MTLSTVVYGYIRRLVLLVCVRTACDVQCFYCTIILLGLLRATKSPNRFIYVYYVGI